MSTKKKRLIQIGMGIATLIICVAIVLIACNGNTYEERDITPILFMAPISLMLIFTRETII